jgi:regulator of replication initiation timing
METYPTNINDSIIESLSKGVLNLGNECRALAEENKRLKEENEMLKGRVNYWKIEAECDHGRWLRTLEDLEHLRRLK